MSSRIQTTEERIAQIADGFNKGIQNYQVGADRNRAQMLQDEALKRQQAMDAMTTTNQLATTTGRYVEPSVIAPMLRSGDFTGLGDVLSSAPLSRDAELKQRQLDQETENRALQRQYKEAQIKALEGGRSGRAQPIYLRSPEEQQAAIDFENRKEKSKIDAGVKTAPKQDNITADMRKAATFAERVEQAENVLSGLSAKGFDRSSLGSAAQSYLPNVLKSESLKQQDQAERNFVNSILRRESGAAIAPTEFASAELQYFDREGDTPAVKAQKKQNRLTALAGLKAEAGKKATEQIQSYQPQQAPQAPQQAQPMTPEQRYQYLKAKQAGQVP